MSYAIRNADYAQWSAGSPAAGAASLKGAEVFEFARESRDEPGRARNQDPWRILIVDDDPGVHQATLFALQHVRVLDRPLTFLHAHTAQEALAIMRERQDVAVILLDVVMEHEAAGLAAVGTIRGDLGNLGTRIILRTGQPGYAPETETVLRYDINGYTTKGELTRNRLLTAVTSAIRSYDQICRLETSQHNLCEVVSASYRLMAEIDWQRFASTLINEIATLLNLPPNGLVCSQAAGANEYRVVAAAGDMAGYLGHTLAGLPERLRDNIETCIGNRHRLVADDKLYFHFKHHVEGEFVAVLETGGAFPRLDPNLLDMFALTVAVCGDNVRLVESLRNIAYQDTTVGLPNRNAFVQSIDERIAAGLSAGYVVALLDIDQFAEANEMFGNAYGDQLLLAVAQRLSATLGAQCLIARIANDTFGLFATEAVLNPNSIAPLLHSSYEIDGIEHPVSMSAGFVRLDSVPGVGTMLLQDAYLAIKLAKSGGHGQVAYYSPQMAGETRARTQLLQDLGAALRAQQLFVVYQPQVELASGRVCGFEALVRWRRADGEMVAPDRFIPVAEQSGLIIDLGNWVMQTALHALREIHAAGHADVHMAVNVSARQFERANFLPHIEAMLAAAGIAPHQLEIEVTESVALVDAELLDDTLASLRMRGISVAIDDFGTGYSSLSYLDRLPATRLKIDRAFVRALETGDPGARIVEMVIPLGHQLNMAVLAEGVETAEQAEQLRQLGCNEGQGYYFARPMLLADALQWLAKRIEA